MFINKFGRLHAIDNAKVTTPAARRQKSKNAQEPINFFDGIFVVQENILHFLSVSNESIRPEWNAPNVSVRFLVFDDSQVH